MEVEEDIWSNLDLAPADPILGTAIAYKEDKDPNKVNLGIGAYRTEEEKPYVFQVVREVEADLIKDTSLDKEYLPIHGLQKFCDESQKLLFGEENPLVLEKKICTVQALSGTGSLRLGLEFLKENSPGSGDVYISNPTWGNHLAIIRKAGLNIVEYPYFDPITKGLSWDKMTDCLNLAKAGSIILLHVCAHNPTGVDPSPEQWETLALLLKEKKLFPFFDSAYQGYATGDLEKDVIAIKIFLKHGLQMIVAQSFAKNFGLYGERIGALHFVCKSKDIAEKVMSQIKMVIRPMYSNPPIHGALLVSRVLGNKVLAARWKIELYEISQRIQKMRQSLKNALVSLKVNGNWDHITKQIGMFSYTGLSEKQCLLLIEKYHIYLLKNGRISMAGINSKNVDYIAKAIKDAIETYP